MKQNLDPSDDKLSLLLKTARAERELPPGFQNRVWQRIEKLEQNPDSLLDILAAWVLRPRIAAGALAAIVLVAASFGAVHGAQAGISAARDRYVASVDPAYLPH
jgi:hypothetical protein